VTGCWWISYEPTQADVVVFKSLPNAPVKASHPHAARWYKHVATYEKEFSSLPGDSSKSATDYIPIVKAQAAAVEAADDDDDEVDLFGSDDEEDDAEAERVKQERLKAYAEKKAAKPKTIAKSIVTLDVRIIFDLAENRLNLGTMRRIWKPLRKLFVLLRKMVLSGEVALSSLLVWIYRYLSLFQVLVSRNSRSHLLWRMTRSLWRNYRNSLRSLKILFRAQILYIPSWLY
jgi:hypothetical protein